MIRIFPMELLSARQADGEKPGDPRSGSKHNHRQDGRSRPLLSSQLATLYPQYAAAGDKRPCRAGVSVIFSFLWDISHPSGVF